MWGPGGRAAGARAGPSVPACAAALVVLAPPHSCAAPLCRSARSRAHPAPPRLSLPQVANLLLLWLGSLPEPLFPAEYVPDLLRTQHTDCYEERVAAVRSFLKKVRAPRGRGAVWVGWAGDRGVGRGPRTGERRGRGVASIRAGCAWQLGACWGPERGVGVPRMTAGRLQGASAAGLALHQPLAPVNTPLCQHPSCKHPPVCCRPSPSSWRRSSRSLSSCTTTSLTRAIATQRCAKWAGSSRPSSSACRR